MVAVSILSNVGWCLKQLGNEATWRENEDSAKKAILIVDPTQQVTHDGFVIGWNVYTTRGRRSQAVHLQIWRPVDAANHRYGNNTGIPGLHALFHCQQLQWQFSYYIRFHKYMTGIISTAIGLSIPFGLDKLVRDRGQRVRI